MSLVRDPAAQPERTWFAWRRTTLAGAIVLALCVRHTIVGDGGVLGLATVGSACCVWLLLLTVAHVRMRALESSRPRVVRALFPLVTAGSVVLLAVLALMMLVVTRH